VKHSSGSEELPPANEHIETRDEINEVIMTVLAE
jgi:hypothetical protein